MKRMKDCPKCGESFINPKYENYKNIEILSYICSCGYSWIEQPLDAIKKLVTKDTNK